MNNSSKKNVASPKPGPSHMYVDESDMDVDSDECDQIEEKDKCCVCGKFQPDAVRNSVSLFIDINKFKSVINCFTQIWQYVVSLITVT